MFKSLQQPEPAKEHIIGQGHAIAWSRTEPKAWNIERLADLSPIQFVNSEAKSLMLEMLFAAFKAVADRQSISMDSIVLRPELAHPHRDWVQYVNIQNNSEWNRYFTIRDDGGLVITDVGIEAMLQHEYKLALEQLKHPD